MFGARIKNPTHKIIVAIMTAGALVVGTYYLRPGTVSQAQHDQCQQQFGDLAATLGDEEVGTTQIIYSSITDSCLIANDYTDPTSQERTIKVVNPETKQQVLFYKQKPQGFYLEAGEKITCETTYYYLDIRRNDQVERTFGCEQPAIQQQMRHEFNRYGFNLLDT